MVDPEDDEAIHGWFGLTYANYLVLHRATLQSMPPDWQREFVELLEELREAAQDVPGHDTEFWVRTKDDYGKFTRDLVPHYNRGRTKLELRNTRPDHNWERGNSGMLYCSVCKLPYSQWTGDWCPITKVRN